MNTSLRLAVEASLVAIVITGTMDLTGFTIFSALPLMLLIPFYAFRARISPRGLGFAAGRTLAFLPASVVIPIAGIGAIVVVAYLAGDVHLDPGENAVRNLLLAASVGVLMVAITEEGFFRGVLWRLFDDAGYKTTQTLAITTVIFVAWHLPAVLFTEEFAPPLAQVPLYIANALLLGYIWGALRVLGASIWVPSIYHSVWNALAYDLFGFGERLGHLGIEATWIYGPEIGFGGIVVNGVIGLWCWRRLQRASSPDAPTTTGS